MNSSIYRTLLIDDETLALNRLERMLKPYKNLIEILDKAKNGLEAIEKINVQKPDLIFLDIQMPELNGFDVLEKIEFLPIVIFSTAYDQYALKAFETNSVDYLLKPVSSKRLKNAIEKLKRLTDISVDKTKENLKMLISQLKPDKIKRIQVRTGDKIKLINVNEIHFLKADNKYVEVYTFDKKYLINDTLTTLEENLPEDFVRIHRSYIININSADEFFRLSNSIYNVKMKDTNKTILPVSRNMKGKLGL